MMRRLGELCARRPWTVIVVWIAIACAVALVSRRVGSRFAERPTIPASESQRAADLVRQRFPSMSGASARVVFKAKSGTTLLAPAVFVRGKELLGSIARQPHVLDVSPPHVAPSGTIAVAEVRYDAAAADLPGALERLRTAAHDHGGGDFDVAFSGELVSLQTQAVTGPAEAGGLIAALVVLFLAFRSVVAGMLPILTALLSVALGVTLVGALGTRVEISTIAPTLATMVGLGVGIDYALFLLTRFREELSGGLSVAHAVAKTTDTAGRAVVFAALTVVVAMLGLALCGVPFVAWMGVAVSLVVVVAMAASTTLLPALFVLLGPRIDRLRIPRFGSDAGDRWRRWSERVAHRPVASLISGLACLCAIASPVLGMRLGVLDDEMSPAESTQHIAYEWIAEGFGAGGTGPIVVVVAPRAGALGAVDRASAALGADPDVSAVLPPVTNADKTLALVTAIPRGAPQDPSTSALVHRLRGNVLQEVGRSTGAETAIGGLTPLTIDLDEAVGARLPLVVAAVLGASFVLLLVVFRSLLVPLKAVVLNLLSVGAACGVVVLVFQHGVGLSLLGLAHPIPIVSFLPLLMFAVLFGLSMDYEVFILTRVREEHVSGVGLTESISRGIAKTAGVVSSAAIIMVIVFASFALGHDPALKMFGIGLACAVALDATVVRLVLVPASMVLLGTANWWLPGWLARLLPRVDLD
jgi:RND superfamily putative drug exporter